MNNGSEPRTVATLAIAAATGAIILACALAPLVLPGGGDTTQRLFLLGAAIMGAITVVALARE